MIIRHAILWSALLLLHAAPGFGQEPAATPFTVEKAIPFNEAAPKLTLDLYRPAASSGPPPCIIVIQGGGFLPQNGQRFKPFAEHLAKHGFAAALISYRGSPKHQHRDTLNDVRASVRHLRQHAQKFGIDPERIGATGRSAGGTLAALLAVNEGPADAPLRIQAAVCFAGVFDFVTRFTDKEQLALQPGYEKKIKTNGAWIGTPFAADDKEWLAASATSHIDAKDAPTLFLHAKNDAVVPWMQSRDMHRAMLKAGIASEIHLYDTGGHGVRPKDHQPLDEMIAFFKKQLSAD